MAVDEWLILPHIHTPNILKQTRLQIYIVFLVIVHLLVLSLSVYLGHHRLKDSTEYLAQAQNLENNNSWYSGDWQEGKRPELFSRRPPGYGMFLNLLSATPMRPVRALLGQMSLSFLTFLTLGLLINFYRLPLWPLILGLAFFPSQLIYTQFVMSETLFQFCVWSGFLCFWVWRKQERYWAYLVFHLAFALAVIVKPVMLYFWILTLGISLVLALKKKSIAILLPAFLPILLIFAVMQINKHETGFGHFTSIQYTNMLSYNAYNVLIKTEGAEKAGQIVDSLLTMAGKKNSFREKAEYLQSQGLEIILSHPVTYVKFHLKGMINFFLDPGRFDVQTFLEGERQDSPGMFYYFSREGYSGIFSYLKGLPAWQVWLLILITTWNSILALSFILFLFNTSIDIWTKWLIIITVIYICFLTGPVGAARFKVPVYPFLLLTAPFVFHSIQVRLRK